MSTAEESKVLPTNGLGSWPYPFSPPNKSLGGQSQRIPTVSKAPPSKAPPSNAPPSNAPSSNAPPSKAPQSNALPSDALRSNTSLFNPVSQLGFPPSSSEFSNHPETGPSHFPTLYPLFPSPLQYGLPTPVDDIFSLNLTKSKESKGFEAKINTAKINKSKSIKTNTPTSPQTAPGSEVIVLDSLEFVWKICTGDQPEEDPAENNSRAQRALALIAVGATLLTLLAILWWAARPESTGWLMVVVRCLAMVGIILLTLELWAAYIDLYGFKHASADRRVVSGVLAGALFMIVFTLTATLWDNISGWFFWGALAVNAGFFWEAKYETLELLVQQL